MSAVEFHGSESCVVYSPLGEPMDAELTLGVIRILLRMAQREKLGRHTIAVRVDGWSKPWPLFLDGRGDVRAICPTSAKVTPLCEDAPASAGAMVEVERMADDAVISAFVRRGL